MTTPFQKKFPNADKDTLFKVVQSDNFSVGEVVTLRDDDGTTAPFFEAKSGGEEKYMKLSSIEFLEPHEEFKQGDIVEVSNDGENWAKNKYIFIADKRTLISNFKGGFPNLVLHAEGAVNVFYSVRKPKPTEIITLSDGTKHELSKEKLQSLIDESKGGA